MTNKQRKLLGLWAAEYHKLGTDPGVAPHLSEEDRRFKLMLADAIDAALAELRAVERETIDRCIAAFRRSGAFGRHGWHGDGPLKCIAALEALKPETTGEPS
jgi:hypothetical protein